MKIAVVSDDGKTISRHFGRAQYYVVFTVEDGEITGSEQRDKAGHRQFAAEEGHHHHEHDHDHEHDHEHDHDHEHGHGHDHAHGHGRGRGHEHRHGRGRDTDPRGHGFGHHADRKHNRMVESITDCEAVLVRGMGRGAYIAMENANIKPVVTDIPLAEDAVKAYIKGDIVDHTDKLH
jgi:predicted Fe-Mo cluster-binding NifX family protein